MPKTLQQVLARVKQVEAGRMKRASDELDYEDAAFKLGAEDGLRAVRSGRESICPELDSFD